MSPSQNSRGRSAATTSGPNAPTMMRAPTAKATPAVSGPRADRLGPPFREAALTEVAPPRSPGRHAVQHTRALLEQRDGAGASLTQPDAELRLLAADRQRADPADVGAEPADQLEDLPAER